MSVQSYQRTWTAVQLFRASVFVRGLLSARLWVTAGAIQLESDHAYRADFEASIDGRWCDGLDRLEFLYSSGIRAVEAARDEINWATEREGEAGLIGLLVRLHARSALVLSEILALLRTGHADGAMARWRTLHEIAVTMRFIAAHGEGMALRYVEHFGVRNYKAAIQFNKYAERLGEAPIDDEEIAELATVKSRLVECYGQAFWGDYGWAAEALERKHVSFVDIELAAQFDHARPWYRLASEGQHAGPHGIFFSLAADEHGQTLMLAGPSNAGLEAAGSYAAMTYVVATMAVLALDPTPVRVSDMIGLQHLAELVEEAFNEAAEQLDEEEAEKRRLHDREGTGSESS